MTFVRGKGGYVPFRPGGLDQVYTPQDDMEDADSSTEDDQTEQQEKGGWKKMVPGLKRGIQAPEQSSSPKNAAYQSADAFLREVLGEDSFKPKAKRKSRAERSLAVNTGLDEQDASVPNVR